MKTLGIVLLLVACGHTQGGGGGDSCDITTDDGVNAALAKLGRPPQPKEEACIEHGRDGRIAEIGDFADDRGCAYAEVFVGCRLEKLGDDRKVLGDLGWSKMTAAEKQKLVPDYLAVIYEDRADTSASDVFGKDGHPAFEAPAAVVADDGSVTYTGWFESNDGGGMTRATQQTYTRYVFHVAPDGGLTSNTTASFSIPYP